MTKTAKTHLTFPCTFPIKVMGEQDAGLEDFVKETLEKHIQASDSIEMQSRHSTHKNYISITATFTANSKEELDNLYKLISANPAVKMVL